VELTIGGLEPLAMDEAAELIEKAIAAERLEGKSVLFIIPDSTRSFPSNFIFTTIHRLLSGRARKMDFLIALGTHKAMDPAAVSRMLGISEAEMASTYADARVLNHSWDEP
jgi:nickel-dependent lactate racemase